MKEVNILSIIEAYRNIGKSSFNNMVECMWITSGIKEYELCGYNHEFNSSNLSMTTYQC